MHKKYIAVVISLVIFILLAIFTVSGQLDGLNNWLMDAIHSLENPVLTVILKIITNIGEWFVYVPVALLLFAVPKLRWRVGFPAAITLAISAAFNALLKHCFAIPRPDTYRLIMETGFGFPSGHAMNGTAFIGICTLLFVRYSSNIWHKLTVSSAAALFILAVGFSRVYLGVHTPADIMAGYAMGIFLCLCVACATNRIEYKSGRRTK